MKLIIDSSSNRLIDICGYDRKILNDKIYYFKGNLNGLVESNYYFRSFPEDKIIENLKGNLSRLSGEFAIVAASKSNNLEFVANDVTGITELYYGFNDGIMFVNDDLFELSNLLEYLSISKQDLDYFLNHGYCRPGKTYFNEIFRIPPGMFLYHNNSQWKLKSYMDDYEGSSINYKIFKNSLNSIFENSIDESACHNVLFSGGIDSTVILTALLKKDIDVTAVTFLIQPEYRFNKADVIRSKLFSEKYNFPCEIVEVNFDNLQINDLLPLIRLMPFSSHLSLGFLETFKKFKKKKTTFWCGQNSDTLYNLGPTDRYSFIHRFLLSDCYIKMLTDVCGSRKYQLFKKFFDFLIKSYYKSVYSRNYITPDYISDLVCYLIESDQYLALTESKENCDGLKFTFGSNEKFTPENSVKMLFDAKLGSFYTGGDNKSVYYSSKLANSDVIMPYSNTNMLYLYRNLNRGWEDVFIAKRFLYEYAKKELGINKSRINHEISVSKFPELNQNELSDVIFDTKFGEGFKKFLNSYDSFNAKHDITKNLTFMLSEFWFKKIYEMLLDNNVEIR